MPTEPAPRRRATSATAIGVVTAVAVVSVTAVMVAARVLPAPGEAEAADVPEHIAAGETVSGTLQGTPAQHLFDGTAGQVLTIDLRGGGGGLDPYLRLLGPSGSLLGEDDDGGGNLDSRLRVTLEEDGEHVILAGGLGISRGAYRLSVQVRQPAAAPRG